jgi:NAD(P)-dependent dehydrogenase (short-subunit alcohol dehydrogenase family)
MAKRLEGKTAVITGGTEGIGLATARLFVEEGAYVFITGRRQKELDEAEKQGRVDIVFANAGVGEFAPFGAVTEEHFDRLFNINVRGTLFTVQKALPLLNDGGSIILNGSVASVKGTADFVRAHLDDRSQGPSYSLKRCESWSDQYAAGESAICRGNCADGVHHPDGTHGNTRGSSEGRVVSRVGRLQFRYGYRAVR